ncbi:MAG: aminoacyl-tRNA hydrolase [Gammaproteobacteria bacterium]|nr:aminoacyl-tRNA hydrolase [Gammaproteobacteria bacterium]MBV9622011.1 aminoacyl-tRNA hydrolase [Gammaproteobacteria bacterium]
MPLPVRKGLEIPDEELTVTFVRSSGPGGQNVNKVASAVQLRFALAASRALDAAVKTRLRALAGRRVTAQGELLILARTHRTQEANRREAEHRLTELIRAALPAPRPRRATRPTRGSQERRLARKARAGRTKQLRGRPGWDG